MPEIPAALTKKVGPFPVYVYGIIGVGAVSVGLYLRKRTKGPSLGEPGNLPDDEYPVESGTSFPATQEGPPNGYGPININPVINLPPLGHPVWTTPPKPPPIVRKPPVHITPKWPKAPTPKPKPPIKVYTVARGDTLSAIARRYHTTWQKIFAMNRGVIGANPNLIRPGQKLKV